MAAVFSSQDLGGGGSAGGSFRMGGRDTGPLDVDYDDDDDNHRSFPADPARRRELSLKQQVEIRQVFKVFDADGSGSISLKELRMAVRSLGFELDHTRIADLVRSVDFNDSGGIELDEFEAIVST
jgi:hypothetical protein